MKPATLKISIFVIITLAIFSMLAGFLVYRNAINALGIWDKANKMIVYLKVDTTADEKSALLQKIKSFSFVAAAMEIDRTEAGIEFQKSLKEYSSGLITTDELIDLIPESIEVELEKSANTEERARQFAEIENAVKSFSYVDEVSYSASWLKKFEGLHRFVRSSGHFVFLLLLLLLSYLVALMIRAYIDDSKQEIEVYNMLGATRWSLYRLFLSNIIWYIAASLAVSFGALFAIFRYLKINLGQAGLSRILVDNLIFLSPLEIAGLSAAIFAFIYANSIFTVMASVNRLNQISND
jgi:cell division protein FtsX